MGVETLVAEPPAEAFETLDALCTEYKINLAIHNHPKDGIALLEPGPGPQSLCNCSPRIGGCPTPAIGCAPARYTRVSQEISEASDYHPLKDAEQSGKRDSRMSLGHWKSKLHGLLQQLHDWKWRGVMTIEYEHLSPQLVPDVVQCVKFVEDFATAANK